MFWCLDLTTAVSRVTILLDKYNLDPRWPSAAICSIAVDSLFLLLSVFVCIVFVFSYSIYIVFYSFASHWFV